MNQSIQLKLRKFPTALAELSHSNQFLKLSAFSAYLLCGIMAILLFYQATKPLEVLTLAPDGSLYQEVPRPDPKVEIERAIHEYLKLRYNWTPKTIVSRIKETEAFILPATRRIFEVSTVNVVRFSQEKNVTQRVYPDRMQVNLEKQTVFIQGDRVTSIQGLNAAGDLKLELSFGYGPRTAINPWGVYVTKEREE